MSVPFPRPLMSPVHLMVGRLLGYHEGLGPVKVFDFVEVFFVVEEDWEREMVTWTEVREGQLSHLQQD